MNTAAELHSPYQAGRDYAINGANTVNCHFRWFATKESTREWERGRDSVLKPPALAAAVRSAK